MILCVTLNPCLDKTLTVPPWSSGQNVRGLSVREVVGGKGNNVARALARLGRVARPVTFLGGSVGDRCRTLFEVQDRFDPLVIPTASPTREILTVLSEGTADQTAFFDPDPAISEDEAERLLSLVEAAMSGGGIEALTLSGSSPSLETHTTYAELIGLARLREIPGLLDTYGPPLKALGDAWPDVLQLNRREAGGFLGIAEPSDQDLWKLLGSWSDRGVRLALVTDGPGAVLARASGARYRIEPPTIRVVNPIGSGDSLLAGLADSLIASLDVEDTLRRGIACASANAEVWDAGAIEPAAVARLEPEVSLERLD
ncbi:PfkB family carbohydrate kinase [Isosphaeraceae bacterium EP7]